MKQFDGIADNERVLFEGFYSEGYPWETGWSQESGCSVAQDGRDILAVFEMYGGEGAKLRSAIRHAELLGDPVPPEAYARLAGIAAARSAAQSTGTPAPAGVRASSCASRATL